MGASKSLRQHWRETARYTISPTACKTGSYAGLNRQKRRAIAAMNRESGYITYADGTRGSTKDATLRHNIGQFSVDFEKPVT